MTLILPIWFVYVIAGAIVLRILLDCVSIYLRIREKRGG